MNYEREKFWMVWRKGSPDTRMRHMSKELALAEAERLARKCPSEIFYVLKATAAVVSEPTPVKRIKLVLGHNELPF